jgi:hypothetical protein
MLGLTCELIVNQIAIASILVFAAVLVLVLNWQGGRLKFLGKRLALSRTGIALKPSSGNDANASWSPRRFEGIALLVVAPLSLAVAYHFSSYLLLCFLYGVSRVQSEHLHMVQMPKGRPWIISNGDQIDGDIESMHFVFSATIWIVLTAVVYLLIRQALPRRGQKHQAS